MSSAILLIAHGSRRAAANVELVEVAALLQQRLEREIVEIAYLELAEPTIPQGLENCIQQGATAIRMLPYFLSAGAHVTRDLVEQRDRFAEHHPQVPCHLCPPLGLHPKIIDVLLERWKEG